MGQIRPVVITVTPIEIISSCTCVTEEIICPHVLSSPCVSMQAQAQRLGCRGETSCTVWNKLSFHHTGFMSTWWKESVRTTSISCCSFQCPGGSWQNWTTYQKQFRVAAPLSRYEKGPACPPLLRPLLGDPPLFSADWKASASTSGFGTSCAVDNCLPGQNVHFWPNKQMSKAHTVQTTRQRTCLQKVLGDILCSFTKVNELLWASRRLVLHLQGALESWAGLVKKTEYWSLHPQSFWFNRFGIRAWEFSYLTPQIILMLLVQIPYFKNHCCRCWVTL